MRSIEETGMFPEFNDKANEAYRTYASLYLDFVDDNLTRFMLRGHDTAPLDDYKDAGIDDEMIAKIYLDKAVEIAKRSLSSGYWKSFTDLIKEYPALEKRRAELEMFLLTAGKERSITLSDDKISRRKAYEMLADYYHIRTDVQKIALKEALQRVPPEEPDTAFWVCHADKDDKDWNIWSCSKCGYVRTKGWTATREGKRPKACFCEACGARIMQRAKDDKEEKE